MRRDDSTWGEAFVGASGFILILAGVFGIVPGAITPGGPILQKLAIGLGGLAVTAVGAYLIWLGTRRKDRRRALVGAGRSSRRSLRRRRR